ncbi:MAG: hypothetical protein KAH25_12850, partial [Bacteroidales bacterium]|nr:hypothetical protein [Bacteroidales bacterium]
ALTMVNCSDDDDPAPAVVDFTADVNGTEVTFSSTMSNVETFEWVYGDGNKNTTDKNPVYAYEKPGNYRVLLNAIGKDGKPVAIAHDVEVLETTEYLLTGGAAKIDGKTWKLKVEVSDPIGDEGVSLVDNGLALLAPVDEDGLLFWIGLEDSYADEFTFVYDGDYKINNADGNSLMGLLYATLNQLDIVKVSSETDLVPLADVAYEPSTTAGWSITTGDFTVDAFNPLTSSAETVTFTGKTQLHVNEYFAFKDFSSVIIIKKISETEMNIAIAIHSEVSVSSKPTYMFHLTFEAVN